MWQKIAFSDSTHFDLFEITGETNLKTEPRNRVEPIWGSYNTSLIKSVLKNVGKISMHHDIYYTWY